MEKRRILQDPPLSLRVRALLRRSALVRRLYRRRWRQSADVAFLSYPKAGRTWARVMLGKALQLHFGLPDDALSLKIDDMAQRAPAMPRIRFKHDENPQYRTSRELVRIKSEYRDIRVIFMVRDPRDLIVSLYFQMTRRVGSFQGSLSDFMRNERGGLDTIIAYYNIWADNRHLPKDFLLVRYCDLRRDPVEGLHRMLTFSGVEGPDQKVLDDAVSYASFDNMRKMELAGAGQKSKRLAAVDPRDPESFKTRKGQVGGYVSYMSEEDIAWMNERIHRALSPMFGYNEPPTQAPRGTVEHAGPGSSELAAKSTTS